MKEDNIHKPLKKMIPLELIKIDKQIKQIRTPFTTNYINTNASSLSYRVNINSIPTSKCTSEGRKLMDDNRKMSIVNEKVNI